MKELSIEKKDKTETVDMQSEGKEEMQELMMEEEANKVDENEVEYSKTSFIIPSCSAWFSIDKIHEIEM